MRESILSDPNRFQHPSVAQLLYNFLLIEELGTPIVVWLDAPNELRRSGYHFLKQIH